MLYTYHRLARPSRLLLLSIVSLWCIVPLAAQPSATTPISAGQQQLLQIDSLYTIGAHPQALERANSLTSTLQQARANQTAQGAYAYVCALGQIVRLQIALGQPMEAQQGATQLQTAFSQVPSRYVPTALRAYQWAGQGQYHLYTGQNQEARKAFEQALEALQNPMPQDSLPAFSFYQQLLPDLYKELGIAYWAQGNQELALRFMQQALQQVQNTAGAKGILKKAAILNNLGLLYNQQAPEQAANYYTQCLDLYQQALGNNYPNQALILVNQGLAFLQMKDNANAFGSLQSALLTGQKLYASNNPTLAFLYGAMGRYHSQQKQYEQATQNYEQALAIYQKAYGSQHPEQVSIYNQLASNSLNQSNYSQAFTYCQQAIQANYPNFNSSANATTVPPLQKALGPRQLLNTLLIKAQAWQQQYYGQTLRLQDLKNALTQLQAADSLIGYIRQGRITRADKLSFGQLTDQVYETALSICFDLAENVLQKQPYYEQAFSFAEKRKAAVLKDAIQEAQAQSFSGLPAALLQKEQSLKTKLTLLRQQIALKGTQAQNLTQELFQTETAYNSLIAQMEREYPRYYALKHAQNQPQASQIQAALPANSALISWSLSNNNQQVYRFILTAKGLTASVQSFGKAATRQLAGLRNALVYDLAEGAAESGQLLHQYLMPKRLPKNINHLILVPEGPLATIPFETLVSKTPDLEKQPGQWAWLTKQYSISYLYAASLYKAPKATPKNPTATPKRNALLVAPVYFTDDLGKPYLPTLPGTLKEVQSLNQVLSRNGWNVNLSVLDQAQKTTFTQAIKQPYNVIHLATHGQVRTDQPELSSIYLKSSQQGQPEAGRLFAGELYNLDLQTDLVVLSACQTGLGRVVGAEGIVGLARALTYAGAKSQMVSLWQVADESTANLMYNFYGAYISPDSQANTQSKAQALQDAKNRMLSQNPELGPHFWAPFILQGQ